MCKRGDSCKHNMTKLLQSYVPIAKGRANTAYYLQERPWTHWWTLMKASSCQGQCGDTAIFAIFAIFQSQIHPPTARFTEPTEPTQTKRESHPLDFSGPRAVSIALCGSSSARHVWLRGAPSPPGPASTDPARDRGF